MGKSGLCVRKIIQLLKEKASLAALIHHLVDNEAKDRTISRRLPSELVLGVIVLTHAEI